MSSGYNEFFKLARQARTQAQTPSRVKPKAKTPPPTMDQVLKKKVLAKKRSGKPPLQAILLLCFGLSVSSLLFLYEEEAENFFDKIELSFLGGAMAQNAPAKASPPVAGETPIASDNKDASAAKGEINEPGPNEDEISYFAKLRDRKRELDQREVDLKKMEEEIAKQKVELEKKLIELEEIRRNISSILKERVEVDNEKVEKLVKIYSKMRPQKAAEAISKIDQHLAVEILGRLNEKAAADILNLLEADKSKTLSEQYSGYRRN